MKRKFLAVFTFMMLLIFSIAFVACTDYTKPEDEKDEETEKAKFFHYRRPADIKAEYGVWAETGEVNSNYSDNRKA